MQVPPPTSGNDTASPTNATRIRYAVTPMRKDPVYINVYVNWFRLLVSGVIPMAVLVILNVNIYLKIVETRRTRAKQQQQRQRQQQQRVSATVTTPNG